MNGTSASLLDLSNALDGIERQSELLDPLNFKGRERALEQIDDLMLHLLGTQDYNRDGLSLVHQADSIKDRLEQVNHRLFERLRGKIKSRQCVDMDLLNEIDRYLGAEYVASQAGEGYDDLDAFVQRLLLYASPPIEVAERDPEMVAYQPTPGRILMRLVRQESIQSDDVLYDLGSGLGQVPIMVNLIKDIKVRGIEIESAYCEYAREVARDLNLSQVKFINADVRDVDLSQGTVFFLYTPFRGKLLGDVLEKLRLQTHGNRITVFTYGPCTLEVARENWLEPLATGKVDRYNLFRFQSR